MKQPQFRDMKPQARSTRKHSHNRECFLRTTFCDTFLLLFFSHYFSLVLVTVQQSSHENSSTRSSRCKRDFCSSVRYQSLTSYNEATLHLGYHLLYSCTCSSLNNTCSGSILMIVCDSRSRNLTLVKFE